MEAGEAKRWVKVNIHEGVDPVEIFSILNACGLPSKEICTDCSRMGWTGSQIFVCDKYRKYVCKDCSTKTGFLKLMRLCKTCAALPH